MKMILTPSELEQLAKAITQVEKSTEGELRLIIVGRSISTAHVMPMLAFMLATLALLLQWAFRFELLNEPLWMVTTSILVCAWLLAWPLSRVEFLQRWLTPDLETQVMMRAEVEFHREGLSHTQGRTGIMLFLSLMEHQAVVLGDRAIAEKLSPGTWAQVVQTMLKGPKLGWKPQLEAAIEQCGEQLAVHFPGLTQDKNELPNHVIVKI